MSGASWSINRLQAELRALRERFHFAETRRLELRRLVRDAIAQLESLGADASPLRNALDERISEGAHTKHKRQYPLTEVKS